MSGFYEISSKNEYAILNASFDVIRQAILKDPHWVLKALEKGGRSHGEMRLSNFWHSFSSPKIISQGSGFFIVRACAGKMMSLQYRIQTTQDGKTKITPEGYIEQIYMVFIPITLLIMCILPVLLTPFIFALLKDSSIQVSKRYLEGLCLYLETVQKGA